MKKNIKKENKPIKDKNKEQKLKTEKKNKIFDVTFDIIRELTKEGTIKDKAKK